MTTFILGAGMAGCLAGALNQDSVLFEPGPNTPSHKALLRFRTPKIGQAVGIPFEKVTVYKGIHSEGKDVPLSPKLISMYSQKVSDAISYRSIRNIDPVERWVAPDNFQERMKEQLSDRIEYNYDLSKIQIMPWESCISTLPIPVISKHLGILPPEMETKMLSIKVSRYNVPDCNVHMTYYYPDFTTGVYRASLQGSTLIVESMSMITENDIGMVKNSFGISHVPLGEIVENFEQSNGKMISISDHERKEFIVNLTENFGIYSLGRFATWRNLVLDDVYKDILVIKELVNKSRYDRIVK